MFHCGFGLLQNIRAAEKRGIPFIMVQSLAPAQLLVALKPVLVAKGIIRPDPEPEVVTYTREEWLKQQQQRDRQAEGASPFEDDELSLPGSRSSSSSKRDSELEETNGMDSAYGELNGMAHAKPLHIDFEGGISRAAADALLSLQRRVVDGSLPLSAFLRLVTTAQRPLQPPM